MAVDFDKDQAPSVSRVNIYLVDPREIRLNPELNGRVELPPIDKFVADFRDPKVGQIQPITITKKDGLPYIVDGVSRWRAALKITEDGEGPFEGGVFKLQCKYFAGSPMECFIATIKANIRNDPKPEDDGYNISRLLHNFCLSEEDIAIRVYGRTALDGKPDIQWVRDRAALAQLAPEALEAFKAGRMNPKAAVALAKLSDKAQKSAVRVEGKITTAAIKRAAAPSPQSDSGNAPATSPAKRKLDKTAFLDIVQRFIDGDFAPEVLQMSSENAIRTVLGQIVDEIENGSGAR